MSPTEKLIDKLKKIKRHAESAAAIGSEAEAQAFADMLNKLLLDNKLEMSDIEFQQMEAEQPVEKHWIDYGKYSEVKLKRVRVGWIEELGDIIARAHFCRILVHPGSSRITLVGRKDDYEVAEYMLMTLIRATERMADDAYAKFSIQCVNECAVCGGSKKGHGGFHDFEPNWEKCRGYRPAWINGFIRRLRDRFYEERRRRTDVATPGASVALVRINKSEIAVNNFFEQKDDRGKDLIKKVHGTRMPSGFNRHGRVDGERAANNINLHANAIKSGGEIKKIHG